MPSTDIIMGAAGAAATSQTYVEDVFSSYLYNGAGAAQSINTGIAIGTNAVASSFGSPGQMNASSVAASMWSVAYSNILGLFVAVGTNASTYPLYATSSNGSTWTTPSQMNSSSVYADMRGVAVNSGGLFVAVGTNAGGYPVFATSSNGSTWTTPAAMSGTTQAVTMYSVAVNSSGKFVAVGYTGGVGYFSTSTNGTTWTAPALFNGSSSTFVVDAVTCSSSGRFMAVGYASGTLYPMFSTSTDGTTWTTPATMNGSTSAAQMLSVAADGTGKFVAVGVQGSTNYPMAAYSTDGTTWTTPAQMNGSSTVAYMYGVAGNATKGFVAVGFNASYYPMFAYSGDGTTWTTPAQMNGSTATVLMLSVTMSSSGVCSSVGRVLTSNYPAYALGSFTPAVTGSGGLVWIKKRSTTNESNVLIDSINPSSYLISDSTAIYNSNTFVTLTGSGYNLTSTALLNTAGTYYGSWSFKKAAKFFDVVAYTGNGTARTIAHSLGDTPGMVIVKATSGSLSNWAVYSVGMTSAAYYMSLNATTAQTSDSTVWNSTAPTASVFSVGTSALTNSSGVNYIAYIFANDTTTNGLMRCGSYTTDASGRATITLGWEPQYVIYKKTDTTDQWYVYDTARGLAASPQGNNFLRANLPNPETAEASNYIEPSATGFNVGTGASLSANTKYMYMAIRRGPMKTPTDPTTVFKPIFANLAVGTANTTSFPLDMQMISYSGSYTYNTLVNTRLAGVGTVPAGISANQRALYTSSIAAEITDTSNYYSYGWNNAGYLQPGWYGAGAPTGFWNFRRAPGFFDVVCYTGVSSTPGPTLNHNLGVVPELIIYKSRSSGSFGWYVYSASLGYTKTLIMNSNAAASTFSLTGNRTPTSTQFYTANAGDGSNSGSGVLYAAYLFASCPGVSKVGSYTGTGAAMNVECGFTGGARFVMIKRTDSTGDWWVWDTSTGMVAGADYRYPLDLTSGYVNANWVYTYTGGFQIVSADASINANGGSYIYLAVA